MTEYRTVQTHPSGYALVELKPITGRTHQLRVHCEAIGTPVLGDPKYGDPPTPIDGLEGHLLLHLHALHITFSASGTWGK